MRRLYRVHLIGIILFAFALRIYRLDAQSIWVDKGISLHRRSPHRSGHDPITMERMTTPNGETFILLPTILTIQEN